jgi:hypothetical protein
VSTTDCNNALLDARFAVNRLKEGPANIDEELAKFKLTGTKWTDTKWTGKDVLFKQPFSDAATVTKWGGWYDDKTLTY